MKWQNTNAAARKGIKEDTKDETISANTLNSDHHRSRHGYHRIHKNLEWTRAVPNHLFHHLDRGVRHSNRHNHLVLASR
jgi:hypothetical protein